MRTSFGQEFTTVDSLPVSFRIVSGREI